MISQALHEFEKVLQNTTTKKHYMAQLRKYVAWSNQDYDGLVNRDPTVIQKELEAYLEFLSKQGHSKAYLKIGFASITLFYAMNDRPVNKVKLAKMMPNNDEKIRLEAYTTDDIRKMLQAVDTSKLSKHPKFEETRLRTKAMIHFLAASGSRFGGMMYLKVKHLEKHKDCYLVRIYGGSIYEYVTFLTPEASKVMSDWLAYLRKSELPDFENQRVFDLTESALYSIMNRIVRKAKLGYVAFNNRYPKPINHAFRYRWNTIAKSNVNVNPLLIERMMGHSSSIQLDKHYLKPSIDQLFNEYQKIIGQLEIF